MRVAAPDRFCHAPSALGLLRSGYSTRVRNCSSISSTKCGSRVNVGAALHCGYKIWSGNQGRTIALRQKLLRSCAKNESPDEVAASLAPEVMARLKTSLFGDTKYQALQRVESSLKEYCMRVDGDERAKCLSTIETLEDEHKAALKRLASEPSEAEVTLERLDNMARELMSCGNTKLIADALNHLQRKQREAAERGMADESESPAPSAGAEQEQRNGRLRAMFDKMDHDNNGLLDIGELRAAMDALDEHLDGAMVAEIVDAMGIRSGVVNFEEFREIVDAEALRARTPNAAALRVLLHDKSLDHFNEWLSSWQ